VGIIAQPDWQSTRDFQSLGAPRLFFGITGGNMDSMVNRYTSDRRVRSDDAYTPGGEGGKRPDRCVIVYAQRLREAYKGIPLVIGGIEASLRRIAHFDYWSDQVRRSLLVDSKADLLVYGNAERQVVAIAQRLDAGERIADIGPICAAPRTCGGPAGGLGRNRLERARHAGPARSARRSLRRRGGARPWLSRRLPGVTGWSSSFAKCRTPQRERSVIRLPSFEAVSSDAVLYAHASRILHLESNPGNARALVQRHGTPRRCGSIRRRFRWRRRTWTPSMSCPMRAGRIRNMARRASRRIT
jgi:uncharacterized radical SAM protein YgiQ